MTRARSVFLALLVVGAALTGGVGTASAGGPCDTVDKWIWQVTVGILNDDKCDPVYLSDDLAEMGDLEAQETKLQIHSAGATQAQNNDNLNTTMGNYMEDTRTVALVEGKNAYIKALNNGSSEAAARNAATQAVANYYSVKQKNLIAQWNTSITVWLNARQAAASTTDVSKSFATFFHSDGQGNYSASDHVIRYDGNGTSTVTLENSSTETVESLEFKLKADGSSYGGDQWVTPTNVPSHNPHGKRVETYGLRIQAPDDNYEAVDMMTWEQFQTVWNEIGTQNTAVQGELDTFITNTYDAYEAGQINNTDLVDPYLGSRNMGPNSSFQTWALSSTLALGLDGPENLSNVGKMVVQDKTSGLEYEGILLSHETPTGGFSLNATYNATTLNGTQMLITETSKLELEGEFVVKSATDTDGNTIEKNVTYRTVNYNTADTTEYQALMSQISNMSQAINERQTELGGGTGGSGMDNTGKAALIVGGIAAVLLVGSRAS